MATRCAASVIPDERIESSVVRGSDRADSLDRNYRRSTHSRLRAIALARDAVSALHVPVEVAQRAGILPAQPARRCIGGDVLAINQPMTVFAKAHGFALSPSHDGPTSVRVELRLERAYVRDRPHPTLPLLLQDVFGFFPGWATSPFFWIFRKRRYRVPQRGLSDLPPMGGMDEVT